MANACRSITATLLVLFLFTQTIDGERWSRQLSRAGLVATPTGSEWVPLKEPCATCVHSDRTQGAKVLSYPSNQQSPNIQPNLIAQSSNNLQYNLIPESTNRFALPGQQNQESSFGTSYQTVNFHNNHNQQQFQIQHPSSGSSRFSITAPASNAPQRQQSIQQRPQFIEQNYQKPAAQALTQESNFVNYAQPAYQTYTAQTQQTPPPFIQQQPQPQQQSRQQQPQQHAGEEVQLLYVPLDTLYQQKNFQGYQGDRYNVLPQPVNAALINDFYSPSLKSTGAPSPSTASTYRATTPVSTRQDYYGRTPAASPSQTPLTKPKAHQPPLAMFMRNDKSTSNSGPNDVLSVLRGSSKIDVLDSINKKSPKVFIGPSALPAPDGYSKYELPYLSTIDTTRLERKAEKLPFFVAPLSYKTPPGFSKIPLPEPHVGSVVVNSIESYDKKENNNIQYSPASTPGFVTQYQQPSSSPARQIVPLSASYAFNGNRQQSQTPAFATTPKPRITTYSYEDDRPKGNQYSYDNTLKTTPVTQVFRARPTQTVATSPKPVISYTTPSFKPPQHFNIDEYFGGDKPKKKAVQKDETKSIKSSDTDRFNFKPIPENIYPQPTFTQTSRPNKYDVFPNADDTIATAPPRPTNTNIDNEYRMKQYFKEQTDFKKFESSTPTKSAFDFPSTTSNSNFRQFASSTPRTVSKTEYVSSTPKTSFYENFSAKTESNSAVTPQKTFKFKIVDSIRPNFVDFDDYNKKGASTPKVNYPSTARPDYDSFRSTTPRFTYAHEEEVKPIYNQNRYQAPSTTVQPEPASPSPTLSFNSYEGEKTIKHASSPAYEVTTPSTYHLPSELPAISPSLPGLINSLPDDKWMDISAPVEDSTTTEKITRRPVNRGRRPAQQYRTSTSVSYSAMESTRRPIQRNRGSSRTTQTPRETDQTQTSQSGSQTTRTPVTRNPGRVKYNPTNEERSRFRTRNRTQNIPKHADDVKATKQTAQNIDYQRDVLKQNYPTFRTTEGPPPTTPAPPTTVLPPTSTPEVVASIEDQLTIEKLFDIQNIKNEIAPETIEEKVVNIDGKKPFDSSEENLSDTIPPNHAPLNQFVTSTSRSVDFSETSFAGLKEAVKVPKGQHKTQQDKNADNYPAYYVDGEQRNKKLISSRYNGESTTTEAPKTRRQHLARRPTRPAQLTTTPSDAGEKVTIRPRVRTNAALDQPGQAERKVVRVKTRVRKPATTTEAPAETNTRVNYNFRRRGNYNKNENAQSQRTETDVAEVETAVKQEKTEVKPRFRSRNRFALDTQESQWSTKYSQNSFQPIEESESGKSLNEEFSFNGEPDIITAADVVGSDSYMVNVSAGLYPTSEGKKGRSEPGNDEVSQIQGESSNVNHVVSSGARRRGVWRKVRVHPVDAFETAESQNIGSHFYNSIAAADQSKDYFKSSQNVGAHTKPQSYALEAEREDTIDEDEFDLITSTPEAIDDILATDESPTYQPTSDLPVDEFTTVQPDIVEVTTKNMPTHNKIEEIEVITEVSVEKKDGQTIEAELTTELPKELDEDLKEASSENTDDGQNPSLFSEMKQKLSDLFSLQNEDDKEEEVVPVESTEKSKVEINEPEISTQIAFIEEESEKEEEAIKEVSRTTQSAPQIKDPMGSLIYATSTATEISHETEICYRGRCIKSEKTKIKKK